MPAPLHTQVCDEAHLIGPAPARRLPADREDLAGREGGERRLHSSRLRVSFGDAAFAEACAARGRFRRPDAGGDAAPWG